VPVCVLDDERSVARASRYVQQFVRVPELRAEQSAVDELTAAGRRFGLDGWVLFSTRDETVCALARHRDDLATRFRVPTAGWTAVRSCWDKRETYQLADVLGITYPRTWVPRDPSDVAAIDEPGPYVVKPAIKEHFFYATGVKAWRPTPRATWCAGPSTWPAPERSSSRSSSPAAARSRTPTARSSSRGVSSRA
jgi:predicted ATP-grasp superfamily ATP-dependent carboligase